MSESANGNVSADRQMEAELSLAVNLQRSILPPFVSLDPDFLYSYLYMPYGRISGDVFEIIRISEHERVLVFGDINGHGIHSAMAMVSVQAFLKCYRFEGDRADWPRRLCADIHEFLWRSLRGRMYMSALAVYCDMERSELRFFNAGHFDMIRIDAGNRSVPVNPGKRGAPPLGLLENAEYRAGDAVDIEFADDDVFVVCSDGLIEMSSDAAGRNCIDSRDFTDVCRKTVAEVRESGHWMISPFVLHEAVAASGYPHAHDDVMLAVFGKRRGIAAELRYNDYAHCSRYDVRNVSVRFSSWLAENYGKAVADRIMAIAAKRFETVLDSGFADGILDEESISLDVVERDGKICVTIWDYSENGKCCRELEVAADNGATGVNYARRASRVNEFSFAVELPDSAC